MSLFFFVAIQLNGQMNELQMALNALNAIPYPTSMSSGQAQTDYLRQPLQMNRQLVQNPLLLQQQQQQLQRNLNIVRVKRNLNF